MRKSKHFKLSSLSVDLLREMAAPRGLTDTTVLELLIQGEASKQRAIKAAFPGDTANLLGAVLPPVLSKETKDEDRSVRSNSAPNRKSRRRKDPK